MDRKTPLFTQTIPPDWQFKVQDHLDAMNDAFGGGHIYTPFTAASGIHETFDNEYAKACSDFIDYIETYFESAAQFDDFLKADAHAEAAKCCMIIDLSSQWDNYSPSSETCVVEQAQYIKHAYTQLYLPALHSIAAAASDHNAAILDKHNQGRSPRPLAG